jgi:hypothetical protein
MFAPPAYGSADQHAAALPGDFPPLIGAGGGGGAPTAVAAGGVAALQGGYAAPLVPVGVYATFGHGTGVCECPACDLAQRYAVVYQRQFPAMTPDTALHHKIVAAVAKNRANAPCEMWAAFGFCFHGATCMFPHVAVAPSTFAGRADAAAAEEAAEASARRARHQQSARSSVAAIVAEIRAMVAEHSAGVLRCRVCGYSGGFDGSCIVKVGEMFSYMTCPCCTAPLYQPLMLHLVEAALRETGGRDHRTYKAMIDALRAALPHMARIPLSFEAHRLASTYFGWSLIGSREAAEALAAAIVETPMRDAIALVSMGSGTGYIEHVFAECLPLITASASASSAAANGSAGGAAAVDAAEAPAPPPGSPAAAFPPLVAVLPPALTPAQAKSFSILAFDEILRESRFSVPVQLGTPDVINCLPDPTRTVLLLCWPPFGSPNGPHATMGYDVLRRFVDLGGRSVIYIGDVASTGDYDFHVLLQEAFRPVASYRTRHELPRWMPQEMGLVYAGNDTIGVYCRREPGDTFAYFAI